MDTTNPEQQRIYPRWSRLGHGMFMLGRYKSGLSGWVAGERGDWAWHVDRRLPPKFTGEKIAEGQAATKRAAQLAAQAVIRTAAELPENAAIRSVTQ
jgi:hypothetical protein